MILYPLKSKTLVIQGSIRNTALFLKFWAREPAKGTEAVVDCDENKALIAGLDQPSWVTVTRLTALNIAAAMDPY